MIYNANRLSISNRNVIKHISLPVPLVKYFAPLSRVMIAKSSRFNMHYLWNFYHNYISIDVHAKEETNSCSSNKITLFFLRLTAYGNSSLDELNHKYGLDCLSWLHINFIVSHTFYWISNLQTPGFALRFSGISKNFQNKVKIERFEAWFPLRRNCSRFICYDWYCLTCKKTSEQRNIKE